MRTVRLSKPRKTSVVRFRCDAGTAHQIKRAALLANLDLSDFLRIAALERASHYSPQQPELPGLR